MEEAENEITCDSILIKLTNEQVLFFDPTFISGINIGGIEQYEFWRIQKRRRRYT